VTTYDESKENPMSGMKLYLVRTEAIADTEYTTFAFGSRREAERKYVEIRRSIDAEDAYTCRSTILLQRITLVDLPKKQLAIAIIGASTYHHEDYTTHIEVLRWEDQGFDDEWYDLTRLDDVE
jgi:predicted metalloprotease